MGMIQHNGMFVMVDDEKEADAFERWLTEQEYDLYRRFPSVTNGYIAFAFSPDGSKEGWNTSDEGDARRASIREYCNTHGFGYVDVSFGEFGSHIAESSYKDEFD